MEHEFITNIWINAADDKLLTIFFIKHTHEAKQNILVR